MGAPRRRAILYFGPIFILISSGLRRLGAVVRHRCHILDGSEIDTLGNEASDSRLPARTDPFDHDSHFLHPQSGSHGSECLPHLGGGEGWALLCPLETKRPGGRPGERPALIVGESELGIVISRFYAENA